MQRLQFKTLHPASFFLVAGLLFGVLLNLVTPPFQSPDEFNHFYRAYQISEGNFLPVKADRRLGGYMPKGVDDFTSQYKLCDYIKNYTTSYDEILWSLHTQRNDRDSSFKDFPNTAYYSPVSYLPQSFILFVLRQFHASPPVLYYGGRLFTFLVWLISLYFIIRQLPGFQWLFTLLALLPMNPYIANSFSADTVTNILSLWFIALVLKHIFKTEQLTYRPLLWLGFILLMLALAKLVYIGLAILLLAIPGRKFVNGYRRIFSLSVLFLLPVLVALLWSGVIMQFYTRHKDYDPTFSYEATLSSCADYYAQKAYLLSHPFHFAQVAWNSLIDIPSRYLQSYVGVFAHLDVLLPGWVYAVSYIIILTVCLCEKSDVIITFRQKIIALAAAITALLLLLLSQYLTWDCVGSDRVELLQGRYLVPLMPLVFLLFSNNRPLLKFNVAWLIVPFVLALNLCSFAAIHARFFIPPPAETRELFCEVEEVNAATDFKTSVPGAFLGTGGAGALVTDAHRSGSHSARIWPGGYCFNYTFRGLHAGDIIELEAWEKGSGLLLAMVSKQKGCDEFSFAGTFKSGCDSRGWCRIKSACVFTLNCDSAELVVFAWNAGKETVFVDDVHFKITQVKQSRP